MAESSYIQAARVGEENARVPNRDANDATAGYVSESESDTVVVVDLDEGPELSGSCTWKVENFSRIEEERLYSPEFEIGTYPWRLMLYPKGNNGYNTTGHVSVYLDFPEAAFTPARLYPKVHFELMAVNQINEEKSLKRVCFEANHMFTRKVPDWGFARFLPIEDTLNPRSGFVVNDTLVLRTKITVHRDDYLSTMTRRQTGFVGLKNERSNDHLNALLQCLYHIRCFRKAVYQTPMLETDEPGQSIPLALQSLFYKLQYRNESVDTKDLTKSFGWGTYDAVLQHGIQEMQTILFEKLEERMKGTEVENAIPELFVGHYSNYVESLNEDYSSSRKQPYREIQLDVLGCKDIYESLERFCAREKMDGRNKYDSANFDLRVIRRYARFDSFPPVLQFHLKRFDYDYVDNLMVKINAHYKFYDELDLDYKDRAFLSETSDRTVENKYKLHSVIAHSGGPDGGHCYAFIRSDGEWYKFDDELVKEETEERAIAEQFGVEDAKPSTAYILLYIRVSDWDRIMCPADKEDISEPIRRRLEVEQSEKEKHQKEEQEAYLDAMIKLATERHFAEQLGHIYHFDVVNFDNVKSYSLHKKTPFEDLKEIVSKDFGIPKHLQRFWLWTQRENGTMRFEKPLLEAGCTKLETFLDLRHFRDRSLTPWTVKNALMTTKLFLETPEPGADCLRPLHPTELLIFVKLYQPKLRKLSYVGHLFVRRTDPFRTILDKARRMAGLPSKMKIIGFEELKYDPTVVCAELKPTHTPTRARLINGDIIVIQERVTKAMKKEFKIEYPTVKKFYKFIQDTG